MGLPWWLTIKNLLTVKEMWVQSLGQEGPLEEAMATHSSILAMRTTCTYEKSIWLQKMSHPGQKVSNMLRGEREGNCQSACNARDPGLVPGSRRCPGEGIGYPFQYSWASLVTQLVQNLPAMWETWVWSLGWKDPLEKGKATHSSIPAWGIPCTVYSPWGRKELATTEQLSLSLSRKNEAAWSKQKWHSVVDMSGGESKVRSCKE